MVLQLATVQHGMKARATAPVPALHVQTQPQILLVGLGPHARRIYMHYFAKHKLAPAAVVELAEKQSAVTSYLAEKCLTPDVHFVDNAQRDADTLSPQDIRALDRLILRRGITHVILSTEPKAHMAYLRYFISRGIHTLTDKPITAPVSPITDATQAARIEHDYDTLMAMYAPAKAKGMRLSVQCQRRFHPGYVYIRQLLATLTATHNIPVTHMDVYHCDGMWNMPDEYLSRENHPYKYGYGKLYHSGYHFVDLAAWLLQGCQLTASKQPDSATLFSDAKRPLDCMAGLNGDDYANLLGTDRFSSLTDRKSSELFADMGEVDYYGTLALKKDGRTLTHCQFTLLQNGFSRRSWDALPADTYKGNGRVRHERVNIQLGPLANIQVHSYQAKEVKERGTDGDGVGSLEHFDIHIFRNTSLIGGQPVQSLTIRDIVPDTDVNTGFIGYNEHAREQCLLSFLSGEEGPSDLSSHKMGIQIMRAAYEGMNAAQNGHIPVSAFAL